MSSDGTMEPPLSRKSAVARRQRGCYGRNRSREIHEPAAAGQTETSRMNLGSERQLAHARVLRARGSAVPLDGPPASHILDSWARCAEAGLDFTAPTPLQVVDEHELAVRRERAAVVRRLAQAELETLSQQIAGSNFLLAFADPGGIILDLYADHRFE